MHILRKYTVKQNNENRRQTVNSCTHHHCFEQHNTIMISFPRHLRVPIFQFPTICIYQMFNDAAEII